MRAFFFCLLPVSRGEAFLWLLMSFALGACLGIGVRV